MTSNSGSGPPYAPDTATVGLEPTKDLDVPVTAVFLFIYFCLAVTNVTIFRFNRRRHHKFIISALLGGFCNVRVITCSLRISRAYKLDNVSLAIAAEILYYAGVIILYIINLVFAQRILRARHPRIGWHRWLSVAFKSLYALIAFVLVMVISTIVLSFYTLNPHTRKVCRDIDLFGSSYILFFATLPVGFLIYTYSRSSSPNAENFGHSSIEMKAIILLGSTSLAIIIAGFRAGAGYPTPRPLDNPAWYDSRACYYCFAFVPEILIILLFVSLRIDLRFKIPDDSSKVRSFGQLGVPQSPVDSVESKQEQEL